MSSGFGPQVKPVWFSATEKRTELLIISQAHHWISHWDPARHRSVRCGGSRCLACSYGAQKQLRVVVMAVDQYGKEFLLELRERHRERVDKYPTTLGLRIRIRKTGSAKNSPVEIVVIEESHAIERDISKLVDCLGERPVLVAEDEGLTLERNRPGL